MERTLSILGLDAAWTPTNTTGVALITGRPGRWRCIAAESSYANFLRLEPGTHASFDRSPVAPVDAAAVIEHARALAGDAPVEVVAVDMPLSVETITRRRHADDAVSHAFGTYQCFTHSPTPQRPGQISATLSRQYTDLRFPLRTRGVASGTTPALIEVYPHPALVALTSASTRLPYKISKVRKYWRELAPEDRYVRLAEEWARIAAALQRELGALPLPPLPTVPRPRWKAYEDTLDAIVCAWVGAMYAEGKAEAHGDEKAAIWCVPISGHAASRDRDGSAAQEH